MSTVVKAIWLSYDLGLGGDYPGLYKWLDNHKALECGNGLAYIRFAIDRDRLKDLLQIVSDDIKESVALRSGDRLYVVYREIDSVKSNVRGLFIFGRRKSNPWEGYGDNDPQSSEDGE